MDTFRGLIVLSLLLCTPWSSASGKTFFAATCSRSDVQAAIDLAGRGDIVVVPPGVCAWDRAVSVSAKGITIEGAGIGETTILDSTSVGWNESVFFVTGQRSDSLRITGFTFEGGIGSEGTIYLTGDSKAVRIDHNRFHGQETRAIAFGGTNLIQATYGVVDHNVFDGDSTYSCIRVLSGADSSWANPLWLGTDKAAFVEDNVFDFVTYVAGTAIACDGNMGARAVIRNNALINQGETLHGACSNSVLGTHTLEIYENDFVFSNTHPYRAIYIRGGTGVVYANTISLINGATMSGPAIDVTNYRTCIDQAPNCLGDWDRADGGSTADGNLPVNNDSTTYYGTHTGASNIADTLYDNTKNWSSTDTLADWQYYVWNITDNSRGLIVHNTDTSIVVDSLYGGTDNDWDAGDAYKITNGYPATGQVGRTSDMDGDGVQDLAPLYEWNNTLNNTDVDINVYEFPGCELPSVGDHIQANRDFYNDTPRPGYTPYTYPHPLTRVLEFSQIWDQAETEHILRPLEVVVDEEAGARCDRYVWLPPTPPGLRGDTPHPRGGPSGETGIDIEIERDGDYVIWGRTIAPDDSSNSFSVSVDDGPDEIWEVQTSNDWTWDQINGSGGADPRIFSLSRGSHTLRVKGMEPGTKLDMIATTNDVYYVPNDDELAGPPCPPTGLEVIQQP